MHKPARPSPCPGRPTADRRPPTADRSQQGRQTVDQSTHFFFGVVVHHADAEHALGGILNPQRECSAARRSVRRGRRSSLRPTRGQARRACAPHTRWKSSVRGGMRSRSAGPRCGRRATRSAPPATGWPNGFRGRPQVQRPSWLSRADSGSCRQSERDTARHSTRRRQPGLRFPRGAVRWGSIGSEAVGC